MNTMLAGIVYFDDILIATPSIHDHITTHRAVFAKLGEWKMQVLLHHIIQTLTSPTGPTGNAAKKNNTDKLIHLQNR